MDGEQSSADRELEERKADHARHGNEQQTEKENQRSEERSWREKADQERRLAPENRNRDQDR